VKKNQGKAAPLTPEESKSVGWMVNSEKTEHKKKDNPSPKMPTPELLHESTRNETK